MGLLDDLQDFAQDRVRDAGSVLSSLGSGIQRSTRTVRRNVPGADYTLDLGGLIASFAARTAQSYNENFQQPRTVLLEYGLDHPELLPSMFHSFIGSPLRNLTIPVGNPEEGQLRKDFIEAFTKRHGRPPTEEELEKAPRNFDQLLTSPLLGREEAQTLVKGQYKKINPVRAAITDEVLDPAILIGAGAATKAGFARGLATGTRRGVVWETAKGLAKEPFYAVGIPQVAGLGRAVATAPYELYRYGRPFGGRALQAGKLQNVFQDVDNLYRDISRSRRTAVVGAARQQLKADKALFDDVVAQERAIVDKGGKADLNRIREAYKPIDDWARQIDIIRPESDVFDMAQKNRFLLSAQQVVTPQREFARTVEHNIPDPTAVERAINKVPILNRIYSIGDPSVRAKMGDKVRQAEIISHRMIEQIQNVKELGVPLLRKKVLDTKLVETINKNTTTDTEFFRVFERPQDYKWLSPEQREVIRTMGIMIEDVSKDVKKYYAASGQLPRLEKIEGFKDWFTALGRAETKGGRYIPHVPLFFAEGASRAKDYGSALQAEGFITRLSRKLPFVPRAVRERPPSGFRVRPSIGRLGQKQPFQHDRLVEAGEIAERAVYSKDPADILNVYLDEIGARMAWDTVVRPMADELGLPVDRILNATVKAEGSKVGRSAKIAKAGRSLVDKIATGRQVGGRKPQKAPPTERNVALLRRLANDSATTPEAKALLNDFADAVEKQAILEDDARRAGVRVRSAAGRATAAAQRRTEEAAAQTLPVRLSRGQAKGGKIRSGTFMTDTKGTAEKYAEIPQQPVMGAAPDDIVDTTPTVNRLDELDEQEALLDEMLENPENTERINRQVRTKLGAIYREREQIEAGEAPGRAPKTHTLESTGGAKIEYDETPDGIYVADVTVPDKQGRRGLGTALLNEVASRTGGTVTAKLNTPGGIRLFARQPGAVFTDSKGNILTVDEALALKGKKLTAGVEVSFPGRGAGAQTGEVIHGYLDPNKIADWSRLPEDLQVRLQSIVDLGGDVDAKMAAQIRKALGDDSSVLALTRKDAQTQYVVLRPQAIGKRTPKEAAQVLTPSEADLGSAAVGDIALDEAVRTGRKNLQARAREVRASLDGEVSTAVEALQHYKRTLNAIKRGESLFDVKRTARGIPALSGDRFDESVAREIEKAFGRTEGPTAEGLAVLATANAVLQSILTGVDASVHFIQGLATLPANPYGWLKGIGMALGSWLPGGENLYLNYLASLGQTADVTSGRNLLELMQEAKLAMSGTEVYSPGAALLAMDIDATPLDRAAKVVEHMPWNKAWSIGRNVSAAELFRSQLGLEQAIVGRNLTKAELEAVGREVNAATGFVSTKGLGIRKNQAMTERLVGRLGAQWFRSQVGRLVQAVNGGMDGRVARRILMQQMGAMTLLYAAAAEATGTPLELEPFKDGKPNKNFLTLQLGNRRVAFATPYRTMMRTLVRTIDLVSRGETEKLGSLYAGENPLFDFWRGGSPTIARLITDGVLEIYNGTPYETIWDQPYNLVTPFSLQDAAEAYREDRQMGITDPGWALGFFGISQWARRPPELWREESQKVAQELGYSDWNEIPKADQLELIRARPELKAQRDELDKYYEKFNVSEVDKAYDDIDKSRNAIELVLASQWEKVQSGELGKADFRRTVSDLQAAHAHLSDVRLADLPETERKKPENEADYYAQLYSGIRIDNYAEDPMAITEAEWDTWREAQRQFWVDNPEAEAYRQYIEVEYPTRNWDDPTVRAAMQEREVAQGMYDQFLQIPKYRGMTLEDGKFIEQVKGFGRRARDEIAFMLAQEGITTDQYGNPISVPKEMAWKYAFAVMQQQMAEGALQLTEREAQLLQFAVLFDLESDAERKMLDPRRAAFVLQNPQIAEWYPSAYQDAGLRNRELGILAGAGFPVTQAPLGESLAMRAASLPQVTGPQYQGESISDVSRVSGSY